MKRIGVITQHRTLNWGSFLQAYATQLFFESIPDVSCEIIDYTYPNDFQFSRIDKGKPSLRSRVINVANKLRLTNIQRKSDRLDVAIGKCLNLSKRFPSYGAMQDADLHYDLYVTGSDQTLNPKFTFGDANFLFSWVKEDNPKIISFAASMPGDRFPERYEALYRNMLSRYSALSVRERNCVGYLRTLTGKDVFCHPDPTLLLTGDEWIERLSHLKRYRKISGEYILLYKINHTFDAAPYIYDLVKWLQDKTGLNVVSLGSSIPGDYGIKCIALKDAGPRDFIELFSKASYVVTSSFHGTAFALNFGRPLYSIVPDNTANDSRQSNLLGMCHAENCIVPIGTPFENIDPEFDVKDCHDVLESKRDEVKDFILKNIS